MLCDVLTDSDWDFTSSSRDSISLYWFSYSLQTSRAFLYFEIWVCTDSDNSFHLNRRDIIIQNICILALTAQLQNGKYNQSWVNMKQENRSESVCALLSIYIFTFFHSFTFCFQQRIMSVRWGIAVYWLFTAIKNVTMILPCIKTIKFLPYIISCIRITVRYQTTCFKLEQLLLKTVSTKLMF